MKIIKRLLWILLVIASMILMTIGLVLWIPYWIITSKNYYKLIIEDCRGVVISVEDLVTPAKN